MTEQTCRYRDDREQAIVAYLYDEFDGTARAAFAAHLSICDACREEIAALQDVRESIGQWSPPAFQASVAAPAARGAWKPWSQIPVWAQAAAAMICLGAGAGLANLDVQVGNVHVRTGWSSPPAPAAAGAASAPWRPELTALEERLRTDLSAPPVPSGAAVAQPAAAFDAAGPAAPDTLRRVRALIDESERRQQRELALRIAEVMRDVSSQRQSDLVKIDRSIGAMQNNTGLEILRQRETINSINNYLVRTASQQRPQ